MDVPAFAGGVPRESLRLRLEAIHEDLYNDSASTCGAGVINRHRRWWQVVADGVFLTSSQVWY